MKFAVNLFVTLLLLVQSFNLYFDFGNELGEIISDYQLHKTKYGDDFATFWSKHFGKLKEQHQAQHEKEHPHKQQNKGVNIHLDLGFVNIRFFDKEFELAMKYSPNFYYLEKTLIPSINKILQPPRLIA